MRVDLALVAVALSKHGVTPGGVQEALAMPFEEALLWNARVQYVE